jgi:Cohesin domain
VQTTTPDTLAMTVETTLLPKPVAGAPDAAVNATSRAPAKPVSADKVMSTDSLGTKSLAVSSSMGKFVWIGPTQAKAGETFQMALSTSLSQTLSQVPLVLRYDPMALTANAVNPGDMSKRAGIDQIAAKIDNVTGRIDILLESKDGKITGQGSLVNVSFEAKGYKSSTTLTASQADIKQPDGGIRSIQRPAPYIMRISQ